MAGQISSLDHLKMRKLASVETARMPFSVSHIFPPNPVAGFFAFFFTLFTAIIRRLLAAVLHPASTFFLGNAIVVALIVKSGAARPVDDPPPSRCATTTTTPVTVDAHDHLGPPPSRCATPTTTPITVDAHDHLGYYHFYFSSSLRKEEEEDVLFEDKAVCVETMTVGAVSEEGTVQRLLCRSGTEVGAPEKWWPEEEEGGGGGEGGGGWCGVPAEDRGVHHKAAKVYREGGGVVAPHHGEALLVPKTRGPCTPAAMSTSVAAAGSTLHARHCSWCCKI